jgi:hypothetical protein
MVKGSVPFGRLTCGRTVDAGGWAVACDGSVVRGIGTLDVVVLCMVILSAEGAYGGAPAHFTAGE